MADLPITAIKIGDRRREDMGDIAALAESIREHDLFHPVVVDDSFNLIAGHRRLLAMESLGWTMIPTRSLGELDERERWECEQDENHLRKDWTAYEESKRRVDQAMKDAPFISTKLVEKDSRGRKSTYGTPKDEIAQAQGISTMDLVRAEQHVAVVDRYPELMPLSQSKAIELGKVLDRVPGPAAPLIRQKLLDHLDSPETAINEIKAAIKMNALEESESMSTAINNIAAQSAEVHIAHVKVEWIKSMSALGRMIDLDPVEVAESVLAMDQRRTVDRIQESIRWLQSLEMGLSPALALSGGLIRSREF